MKKRATRATIVTSRQRSGSHDLERPGTLPGRRQFLHRDIAKGTMALESQKSRIHAEAAKAAFVRAVRETLPAEVLSLLRSRPNERDWVQVWADGQNIGAHCVVEAAEAWHDGFEVAGSDQLPVPPKEIDHHPWLLRRRELDALPLRDRRFEWSLENNETDEIGVLLAPLVFDPALENTVQFLRRARLHAQARIKEAKAHGLTFEARLAPELQRNAKWLVHFQMHGQSYGSIAAAAVPLVNAEAVRKAVTATAELIGLSLRTSTAPI